jgi:hypothetical protein
MGCTARVHRVQSLGLIRSCIGCILWNEVMAEPGKDRWFEVRDELVGRDQKPKPMDTNAQLRLARHLVMALLLATVGFAGAGCQTFSLTEQEFERQQHGGYADREVGQAVDVIGTVGMLGATAGALVAEALK